MCRHAELQIIILTVLVFLEGKMGKADQHALVFRYVKLKYSVIAVGIEKIQSVESRRGHVADCVRQSYHRQVLHSCARLNMKVERYG